MHPLLDAVPPDYIGRVAHGWHFGRLTQVAIRIGIWGTSDLESLGDVLVSSIVRTELAQRLPEAEVIVFGPLGYKGFNRFEDPLAPGPLPLGTWSPGRLAELAEALDVVVITSGDICTDHRRLGPFYGLSADEMAVRDPAGFFSVAAMERNGRSIPVVSSAVDVPDPSLLADRRWGEGDLEARRDALRELGDYPADGRALVVQGDEVLAAHAVQIAAAVRGICATHGLVPVMVDLAPAGGGEEFADAFHHAYGEDDLRLSASAGTADVVAAIAGAGGFIGSSRTGSALAAAFDRPAVALTVDDDVALRRFVQLLDAPERLVSDVRDLEAAFAGVVGAGSVSAKVATLRGRLDQHHDRIAAFASGLPPAEGRPPVVAAVSDGAFADQDPATLALSALQGQVKDLRSQLVWIRAEVDDRDRIVAEMRETVSMRDREIAEQAAHIAEQDERLQRLMSWKRLVPRPVRSVLRRLLLR
jgi:hypothetical protein